MLYIFKTNKDNELPFSEVLANEQNTIQNALASLFTKSDDKITDSIISNNIKTEFNDTIELATSTNASVVPFLSVGFNLI